MARLTKREMERMHNELDQLLVKMVLLAKKQDYEGLADAAEKALAIVDALNEIETQA